MAYCTATEVRRLITTDLSDDDLGELITLADSDLDDMLDGASMSSTQKKKCSMRLVAVMVAQRAPQKESIEGMGYEWGDRVKEWRRYVQGQVSRVIGRFNAVDPLED